MVEIIMFTAKARGKHKPKQINIPLKTIEQYGIKADEQFKVTLERIVQEPPATEKAVEQVPEAIPAA